MATLPSFDCFHQPGTTRCRLLELPTELRLHIYSHALAPTGTLTLTRTKAKRFATTPILSPQLLATCCQIHSEASPILYSANCLYIKVDAHDNCWPTISQSRLPQRVLEKLEHLSVELDTMAVFYAKYADVDWTAFTALVSLKTMRLSITAKARYAKAVGKEGSEFLDGKVQELLKEVLERVPWETRVVFGKDDAEKDELSTRMCHPSHLLDAGDKPCDIDGTALAKLAAEMTEWMEQGCKSGSVKDVFTESSR